MVYRLLTVPMDYTTFASTNPTSKDQKVEEDLNIEYVREHLLLLNSLCADIELDPQQYVGDTSLYLLAMTRYVGWQLSRDFSC